MISVQDALQPPFSFQVQVVIGLVEEEERRRAGDEAGERDELLLPAAEDAAGGIEFVWREAEVGE